MNVSELVALLRRYKSDLPVLLEDRLGVFSMHHGDIRRMRGHRGVLITQRLISTMLRPLPWMSPIERVRHRERQGRHHKPFSQPMVQMRADLKALAEHLLPMSEAESSALGAREWLSRQDKLPETVRAHFWEHLESSCQAFLSADEWQAFRGSREWDRWDAAISAHFAKRRELWLAENKEAMDSSNSFVEKHGLPLDEAWDRMPPAGREWPNDGWDQVPVLRDSDREG